MFRDYIWIKKKMRKSLKYFKQIIVQYIKTCRMQLEQYLAGNFEL